MKLADNEETVKYFDDKRIVKLSVLKMHRAIETREELPAGKYVIVPATLKAGETGRFWLSVYFDCPKNAAEVYNAADKSRGVVIENEEFSKDCITPTIFTEIKDLVKTITSLR